MEEQQAKEEGKEPEKELTEEEIQEELERLMSPRPPVAEGTHAFLLAVAKSEDTTKLGYLKEEEIGEPRYPIRTLQELALFCNDVANMNYFSTYLKAKSEIVTSTSLSKDAKLINLSVLQKREIVNAPDLIPRKENKGWFKKKPQPRRPVSEYG